ERTLTSALNDRLFVHTPSVTETVIHEEPVAPVTGVTVIVRFVPLPPSARLLFGTGVWLAEEASTWSEAPAALPRLPKLKLIGPLELPGGMTTSASGEIWVA